MRILLYALLLLAFPVGAADIKTIQLQDGSRLKGEVISLQNGVYTIRTTSLGLLILDAAKVTSIIPGSQGPGSPDTGAEEKLGDGGILATLMESIELDAIKEQMMNNVDIMAAILELHNDPQLKKVLGDPEIMRAVRNLDIEALTSNSNFKRLLDNPKIKKIQRQISP